MAFVLLKAMPCRLVDFGWVNSMITRIGFCFVALIAFAFAGSRSSADVLIASDDASQSVYDSGWSNGNNGGSGFGAWQFGNSGSGGEFIASQSFSPALSIGSGANNRAFAMWANSGGVSAAVRPFGAALNVGDTFSIDMDNQLIDTNGTVGFSLRNSDSGGTTLAEFYFVGGQSSYVVNGSNTSGSTPGYTTGGLRLSFTLTSANAFSFKMDRLENGVGVDNTVTGNLLANKPVTEVRLFNAHAGGDSNHDLFFNNLSISAVPEVSPVVGLPLAAVVAAGASGVWRRWRNKSQFTAG